MKTNAAFGWEQWRSDQLLDCFPNGINVCAVLLLGSLQSFQLLSDVLVCGEELAQVYECPHDGNVHLDGALAVEHRRKHRHALLCENVGRGLATTTAFLCSCNLQEQSVGLFFREVEHKVHGETGF